MKIKGKKLDQPNRELIVLPRGVGQEDVILWAQAIPDMSPFDSMCPPPSPPAKIVKGGRRELNLEDAGYKKAIEAHGDKRMAWIVLKSLDLPENELEWETVNMGDHRTWLNYEKELRDAGFSSTEVTRIENGCYYANSLSELKVAAARENFLRGKAEKEAESISGLPTEPASTKSGEPVSE